MQTYHKLIKIALT